LADRQALEAGVGVLGNKLAEAVLGLAADRDHGMAGIEQRLNRAGRAALGDHGVERAMNGERIGGHLLGRAVVPIADDLHDLPRTFGRVEDFVDADRAVTVDRVAGQATNFEDLAGGLALIGEFLADELRPLAAHLQLVFVDLHHGIGVEHVVERHEYNILAVGETDDAVEAIWGNGDGDDGIEALVDEILDGAELGGRIGAGRDDLELGNGILDGRILGKGLGGLDHLNAPGIANEAVDHRDAVGARLGRPLQILGIGVPRHEAGGLGPRATDDFGTSKCKAGRRHQPGQRGRRREC